MTTFTGLGGAAGFFGSTLGGFVATGGGGGGAATALPTVDDVATAGFEAAAVACEALDVALEVCCDFATAGWIFETEGAAGLDILDTAGFLVVCTGAGFLVEAAGATFFATGLAILLAAGAFLTDFPEPDDWAGFEADFLTGTIFLTVAVFLAGFAAFFLVAIQLGFFCNKHF